MKFGDVAVVEAEGAVLAHALAADGIRLKKGHVLTRGDVDSLAAAGIGTVVAARLGPGDIGEDEAAAIVAQALVTSTIEARPAATGRVNLHATADGVFRADRTAIDRINALDPAITVATLADLERVETGRMVATVKIIPFAVGSGLVEEAATIARLGRPIDIRAFRSRRVMVIQTTLPTVKPSVLDKTVKVTTERIARSGSRMVAEFRCDHDGQALAAILSAEAARADLVLVFGASAVADDEDVIPAAIRLAGGRVERTGMPVDPGNLLVIGSIGAVPVIGAPGCARSPKENGFDWVLDRLMADIAVTDADIAAMGVGGLLMEIASRPQPREGRPKGSLHGLLLAAGRSSRMGGPNKLLALFEGVPLVRRSALTLAAALPGGVTCVVGHQQDRIMQALEGMDIGFAVNSDPDAGLSASLKAGLSGLPADATGVLVMLADMPGLSSDDLRRLVVAFEASGSRAVVRASHRGKRGNPVILPAALFPEVQRLEGDAGARHLVESGAAEVIDIELGEAASLDVDTPEAMAAAGGVLSG